MTENAFARHSRRDFASRGASLLVGAVATASGARADTAVSSAGMGGEISRSNAAIHQQIVFAASPERVYEALTVAEQFDKIVQLSAAMNSGMKKVLVTAPTQVDAVVGGAISLFGGYVTGCNLELVSNARIVQAWRAGSWTPGNYSIARFVLSQTGPNTILVFDHTGFPNDAAEHLAEGWHINYWEPMTKFLAQPSPPARG